MQPSATTLNAENPAVLAPIVFDKKTKSAAFKAIGRWKKGNQAHQKRTSVSKFWSSVEEDYLLSAYPSDTPVREIAAKVGRSASSVRRKAWQLRVRRPARSRKGAEENLLTRQGDFLKAPVEAPAEHKDVIARTRTGRAIWNTASILVLAELWKRLYSPTFIAEYFNLRPGAVSMAAKRAGLPSRAGLTLLRQSPTEDPMAVPENAAISSQMVARVCRVTDTVFFLHPKHRRLQHLSYLGAQYMERHSSGFVN